MRGSGEWKLTALPISSETKSSQPQGEPLLVPPRCATFYLLCTTHLHPPHDPGASRMHAKRPGRYIMIRETLNSALTSELLVQVLVEHFPMRHTTLLGVTILMCPTNRNLCRAAEFHSSWPFLKAISCCDIGARSSFEGPL